MVLVGYRYSPPRTPPGIPTPGTPLHPRYTQHVNAGYSTAKNEGVGLISVEQLTLSAQIEQLRGMTEVYNLLRIDNR